MSFYKFDSDGRCVISEKEVSSCILELYDEDEEKAKSDGLVHLFWAQEKICTT